jgi:hypothetical protein
MTELERLRKTILDLHGCDSGHIASISVRETHQGKAAWEGNVESFRLVGHPRAKEAFAWSYQADDQQTRYVTVLALPPVTNASDAVRAYFAVLLGNPQQPDEEDETLRAQVQKATDELTRLATNAIIKSYLPK